MHADSPLKLDNKSGHRRHTWHLSWPPMIRQPQTDVNTRCKWGFVCNQPLRKDITNNFIYLSASSMLALEWVKQYIWSGSHCVFSWEAEHNTLFVIAVLSTQLMSHRNLSFEKFCLWNWHTETVQHRSDAETNTFS